MISKLMDILNGSTALAMAQAACAIVLCIAVVLACRRLGVRAGREIAISIARGLVQMVSAGVALALLLKGTLLAGVLILVLMSFAAAATVYPRARQANGSISLCFWAITAGSGAVITSMLATGALQANIATLVPVGSMIIANAMNSCGQAAERFRAEITAHVGQIESGLALGAEPTVTVAPYLQSAVYASLLPRLDMLKSLGLVWIPGVMAGMMLSGASPVYAAILQFIIVAMILAASGITGLVTVVLLRGRVFTDAAQLKLAR